MFGFLGRLRASPHRWCHDNLSAYMDGELSPREHERVRQHLERCADCRRELQGLERTVAVLHRLPRARAPRSFYIPESAPVPSLPVWMRPWAYGALRTATAVVAVLFVVAVAGNALAIPASLRQFAPTAAVSTENAPTLAAAGQAMSTPAGDVLAAAAPAPRPTEWGLGAGPAEEPTLTSEEAARATAAPLGKGGGVEPPSAPPTAEPEAVAKAQATPEPPTAAPRAAALPEPTTEAQAAEGLAGPAAVGGVGEDGAVVPERGAGAYGARGLEAARLRLGRYPWRLWAAATAALLAVLAAAMLWMRAARARWPLLTRRNRTGWRN